MAKLVIGKCIIAILLACSLLIVSVGALAVRSVVVPVPLYFKASCDQLVGTWLGRYSDPEDLLMDGVVRVTVAVKNDRVMGYVHPLLGPHQSSSIQGFLWGTCHNGLLTRVFVANPKQCGHFAPNGGLVTAHMLLLYLPYENAMTNTDVLTVLYRDNYPETKPTAFPEPSPIVKKCH